MRELETRLNEAESFVALRPKLQAKLNQQQTELIATRRELADAQQLAQLAESRIVDTQEQLEMAMLDKEMAEERAEVAEADLEDVKERLAIIEVELEVVREGGGDEGGGDNAVKQSLAYIQLEKQNERLKEALIRSVYLFLSPYYYRIQVNTGCEISLQRRTRSSAAALQRWRRTLRVSTTCKACPASKSRA